jgi:eukaryotic-like serine/threonine-protein kinase
MQPELLLDADHNGDELPPPPSHSPLPLPVVPGYDELTEIGRGGMGVVYRARHQQLGRTVALKLLRAGALAGPQERERFLREARAGAALQHANIVQVFDVGDDPCCPYLAMEFVSEDSLADRLRDGPLPPREAAGLVETLARAVDYAHSRGVIHRDLKPANVLVGSEPGTVGSGKWAASSEDKGAKTCHSVGHGHVEDNSALLTHYPLPKVKIADFGLARLAADEPGGTETGAVLGTPSYMAPEQAGGLPALIGPAADVYALGAILYECLTGRPPFRAATPLETLRQIETVEPVSAARLQPATPRDLDTICLKCLSKEPQQRYASAGALADDLRRFIEGRPILARPVGVLGRAWRWCRRNPRVAALLAALALALSAGFIGVYSQWRRAEQLFGVADTQRVSAEANLHRYEQAAADFANAIDLLDTDQLFHLRAAPPRPELLVPAIERNREFLALHGGNPERRDDVVRAHFRVAILTRLQSINSDVTTRPAALEAGQRALAELELSAPEHPGVQYRRDRAALTHNVGYLLHANLRSEEALPVLESACRQRQQLLDERPEEPDYRSELAGCWNDSGLALNSLGRNVDARAALTQAAALQRGAVEAAPDVPRYRRLLCNHQYNLARTLCELNQLPDAALAVAECRRLFPYDPEQCIRAARVLARLVERPGGGVYAGEAVAALRFASDIGYTDAYPTGLVAEDFKSLESRPDYQAIWIDQRRKAAGK